MEYFNKKEEVLDLVLTEFGRNQLAQGRLLPHYYTFLDNDILYDSECVGQTEAQNDTDRRIKYNTPSIKQQHYTMGAEARVAEFQANVISTPGIPPGFSSISPNSALFINQFQQVPSFTQKFFMAEEPLGTSDLKTPYAPAWEIGLVTNEVSSSTSQILMNLTSSNASEAHGLAREIPQINIEVDYKTIFAKTDPNYTGNDIIPLTEGLNSDGIRLYVRDRYLVVEVLEENTPYLKENFDIQVFYSTHDGGLPQLLFIDDSEFYTTPVHYRSAGIQAAQNGDVDFYLNVLVDNELPPAVALDLGIDAAVIRGSTSRLALSRDLYGDTTPEEGCE